MIRRTVLSLVAVLAVTNGLSLSDQGRRAFLGAVGVASAASITSVVLPDMGSANAASDASTIASAGAKAPSFELPNSRGNGLVSLDSLTQSGKWTVLYFYPGAFTTGCTLEARGFQRDLEDYRKLNTQIVGVSVDPVEKNAQFCTEEKLDFYMLSDKGGLVSKKYGTALSIPGFGTFSNRQTYVIDPRGQLRWIFTDVESRIARHSPEVLEKLNELQTPTTTV
jgi:peroxiredoxin Q/BCP